MQPLNILRQLKADFTDYISSKYPFAERDMISQDDQLRKIMTESGVLFQDPVLQIVRGRKTEKADLNSFHELLRNNGTLFETPYIHQLKAWDNIQNNVPTVVSTGTGSGKSESFIFPVIDGLLKQGFQNTNGKIGAIFLYPMNALVEDQFFRILKYARRTGIKVGIYNGTFKKPSKTFKEKIIKKIQTEIDPDINPDNLFVDPSRPETIPHILLTNYKMLEYMLLRSSDQGLFKNIDLKYLALDEAHIYTGTLGLEISCLLARLQVHLGEAGKNFLPVATSATLMQKSTKSSSGDDIDHVEQMRLFFSQLFGMDFPKDKEWLLKDEYEDLTPYQDSTFTHYLHIPEKDILSELEKPFPNSLIGLSKLFFNLNLDSISGDTPEHSYKLWGEQLYPHIYELSKELPSLLLVNPKTNKEDSVVKYSDAQLRFRDKVKGSAPLLEALLILSSHAFKTPEHDKFPALGLRVHVFTKPEPRIYWSFDKKNLYSEGQIAEATSPVADFISCNRCGHQAWGAVYTPTNDNGGTSGELTPLPAFYEEHEFENGEEIVIFHDSVDIDETNFDKAGWSKENWNVYEEDDTLKAAPTSKSTNAQNNFIRVRRDVKKVTVRDNQTCPSCGGTSGPKERAILGTLRSSASTDLSIYGASILTNIDLSMERRLLLFCDNRQETAFLAGFLTDRHRRLNLRRAIGTFINESLRNDHKDNWQLIKDNLDPRSPKSHRFDLASRILLSVSDKKYWGHSELPSEYEIDKKTLIDLIPRDMLEIDWQDKRDSSVREQNEYKNWLMDNITISDKRGKLEDVRDKQELFNTDRGYWCLETFTKVLIIEMTAVMSRDSSLPNSGILAWGLDGFDHNVFKDYAEKNPDLGLNANGLFLVSHWFLRKLASKGLWSELDVHTIRHVMGKYFRSRDESLKTILGKGLDTQKGLSSNSQIYRILKSYSTANDFKTVIETWSKSETWINFLENSPMERFIQLRNQNLMPVIKGKKAFITGEIEIFRASKSGKIATTEKGFPISESYTGMKDEIWERSEISPHDYYRNLYLRNFDEESRLIRGMEHNGMLGPQHANQIIEDFTAGKINTLVATPTLEMGVDLPDLPVVIHRSVPPDPSNYAQRAGRAGRDPKRALVLTHCGYRSHDLVFYQNPEMMVAGEILPPGLPCENDSIIKRHIQGLVLELLTIPSPSFDMSLNFSWWGDLVNLNELKKELIELSRDDSGLEDSNPIDWRRILDERKGYISKSIEDYIAILSNGLWQNLKDKNPKRFEKLRRQLMQYASPPMWAQSFDNECERYKTLIKWHIEESVKIRKDLGMLGKEEREDKHRLISRIENIARNYLKKGIDSSNNHTYPISYLGSSGFLPNFDFPGATTRFVGTIDQLRGHDPKQSRDEFTLTYDRSSSLALREFAPEQTIYGQGFVYKIDRYVAKSSDNENDNKKWGICLQGCTQLSEPGEERCQFCNGELVHYGESKYNYPKLIEIQQAQGYQEEVISDKRPQRKHHFATQDIRRIGVSYPDEAFSLLDNPDIKIKRYLTPERQIKTVVIMCAEGGSEGHIVPVFKEAKNGNIFGVKLKIKEGEEQDYESFIPSVFSKGQAIVLKLPIGTILKHIDAEAKEDVFYTTLSELITRATYRVLRLNKRNHSLKIILDKINAKTDKRNEKKYEQVDVMILDTEEGGSGVIELIWDYWDEILLEAKRLVEKDCCETGCYECVLSYDNQRIHDFIDKSIFNATNTSLFDALKRFEDKKHRYKTEEIEEYGKTDEKSPIESTFKEFLKDNFSGTFTTQESVFSILGREITRPDFVLKDVNGEDISVFIDGKEYHAEYETMLADIEKRNHIAKQGRRVISIPGKLLAPKPRIESLKALIDPFENISSNIEFSTVDGSPPLSGMEWATMENLQSESLNLGKYKTIDKESLKKYIETYLGNERLELFKNALKVLGDDFLPVAVQEDVLLFPVNGKEVFSDDTKMKWEQYLILSSIFTGLGYRILGVWIGPRVSSKN